MKVKKVMLCDDDRSILEVLQLIVQFSGAEILVESNSAKVYERINETKPDILIVDLWMPSVTGDQLIKQIKSNASLQDIFIVCISASRDGRQVAMNAGADLFLPKPFDMDDILKIVEQPGPTNRASA